MNVLGAGLALMALALRFVAYGGSWQAINFALTPLGIAIVAAWSLAASLSLRGRSRIGKSVLRWGWLGFLALFMAACAVLAVASDQSRLGVAPPVAAVVLSAFGAAMFGGVAALVPLGFLGLPIAHAQALARKGLAGEERGERLVAIGAALASAMIGVQLMLSRADQFGQSELLPIVPTEMSILLGLAAAFLARGRERSRAVFVREVEAGRVEGYRVDLTAKGKVLVRVIAPTHPDPYRDAERHDALIELDEQGAALHPVR